MLLYYYFISLKKSKDYSYFKQKNNWRGLQIELAFKLKLCEKENLSLLDDSINKTQQKTILIIIFSANADLSKNTDLQVLIKKICRWDSANLLYMQKKSIHAHTTHIITGKNHSIYIFNILFLFNNIYIWFISSFYSFYF